jgi:hypothetical protein
VAWTRDLLGEIKQAYGGVDTALGLVSGSTPARVIVSAAGKTYGCSMEDGTLMWEGPAVARSRPTVHGGRVCGPTLDGFRALDEASGAQVHDVNHPQLAGSFCPYPGTLHEGMLAVAWESHLVGVFDLSDGSLAWHTRPKGRGPSGTAQAEGRLLVATYDGNLLVYEDK